MSYRELIQLGKQSLDALVREDPLRVIVDLRRVDVVRLVVQIQAVNEVEPSLVLFVAPLDLVA